MIWLLLPLAFADAIGPGPESCPPGSRPASSHEGEWCAPTRCDNGCPDGHSCQTQGLCVTTEEWECGGMRDPNDPEPCTVTVNIAHGTCRTDAQCDVGSCEVTERCVSGGCSGCSASAVPLGLGLPLLALALVRTRRLEAEPS